MSAAAAEAQAVSIPPGISPAGELMRRFCSLGDNCEFGLVQRQCGVEPMDLLRFSWADLDQVIRAIDASFADIGEPENIKIEWINNEFFVTETEYKFAYHTFIRNGGLDREKLRRKQSNYLKFLSRKCLEDFAAGQRIFIRKGNDSTDEDGLLRLLEAMRRHGDPWLLWVVIQDENHPAGTVAIRRPGLAKAYVERFAPYDDAPNTDVAGWLEICGKAHSLIHRSGAVEISADPKPANLIENYAGFGGWSGSMNAISERAWSMNGPRGSAAVMRHVLLRDTDSDTRLIYLWAGDNCFAPETIYTASAWIWVPEEFDGHQIAIEIAGCESLTLVTADMRKRNRWQRIWVGARSHAGQTDTVVYVAAIGTGLSVFYSSSWRLERHFYPSAEE
jgi:hypothetical protein